MADKETDTNVHLRYRSRESEASCSGAPTTAPCDLEQARRSGNPQGSVRVLAEPKESCYRAHKETPCALLVVEHTGSRSPRSGRNGGGWSREQRCACGVIGEGD